MLLQDRVAIVTVGAAPGTARASAWRATKRAPATASAACWPASSTASEPVPQRAAPAARLARSASTVFRNVPVDQATSRTGSAAS